MKKRIAVMLCLICLLSLVGCAPEAQSEPSLDSQKKWYASIEIENYGTIKLELDYEQAPITVSNFVKLAQEGFYDGLKFHRIIEGFMMQGGQSTEKTADTIVGEFAQNGYENNISHKRGVISMARTSVYDSASSQFFIMHQDNPGLDGKYAAFGHVIEGIEVVDAICTGAKPVDGNGSIRPEERPVIKTITVWSE